MKKIVRLRLSPYSPSPSLPPSSNVVYEDMIDIVEIDVGKRVRSYITSTTLLEGGRGWNENFFPFSPRVLLWSNSMGLTMSLNIFCEGL